MSDDIDNLIGDGFKVRSIEYQSKYKSCMHEYNRHLNNKSSCNNSLKIDKEFLDALSEFIQSVQFEMDIMLPRSASLRFLSHYRIIDYIISQKLNKNITIKMLCSLDEDNMKLIKQLVPFIGYKSIKP